MRKILLMSRHSSPQWEKALTPPARFTKAALLREQRKEQARELGRVNAERNEQIRPLSPLIVLRSKIIQAVNAWQQLPAGPERVVKMREIVLLCTELRGAKDELDGRHPMRRRRQGTAQLVSAFPRGVKIGEGCYRRIPRLY